MKTRHYRDSLIQAYAVHLVKMITEAEIMDREIYISRLDRLIKYDGISKVAIMPEDCYSYGHGGHIA